MPFDDVIDAIGHTPLVRLRVPGDAAVFAKLELQNLFTMKDRAARNIVLQARRDGRLAEGAPIVESSSGSMALGLALVGRHLGHEVHIVTDPRIDPITLAKLNALGCVVHVVPAMTGQGWQSARLERLAQLARELPGAFWPAQYANPDNPSAYATLAGELLADLGRVDVLIGSVGSGGSLCGAARHLRLAGTRLRAVAVDCVGSVLFGQPDRPGRLQSGLGNSIRPPNLDRSLVDEVHWLNDREAFAGALELAAEQQIFGGNTSGSVYRVARHIASLAPRGTRIVAILPDRGDRYTGSVFDDRYREAGGLPALPDGRVPRRVPYGERVTSWSYSWLRPPDGPTRLVFVESNTTGSGMAALVAARAMGLRPVLYTADPGRYRGLSDTGAEVVVCDTDDLCGLAQTLPRPDLAGLTTTSDFYLQHVAELGSRWRLPGNAPAAVARCRDKVATRHALAAAGIPQPRHVAVRSIAGVPAAVDAVGLPCVVKPADDSGSNLVRLCASWDEAVEQAERVLRVTHNVRGQRSAGVALIEQYVEGPEYSVETFGWQGDVRVVGLTAKEVGAAPHFVELGHVFPADMPTAAAARVAQTATAALDAVGHEWGPAHTEIRVDAAGRPYVIEINARLAGGMIPELVRLALGVDLLGGQLCAAVGRPVHLEPVAGRHAAIRFLTAPRSGVLRGVHGLDEARRTPLVHTAAVTRAVGHAVRPPANAYDRVGYVIAAADRAHDARAAAADACARVELLIDTDAEEST